MGSEVIAVFGGSFDPPHSSHLEVAVLVLERGLASRVLLVPCVKHPFAKPMASYEHRLAMCRLLAAEAGKGVEASDIEDRLDLSGYTLDTLDALSRENPTATLRLVMGTDILLERDRWHRFEDVVSLAPPILVVREGFSDEGREALPAPPPISSTQVRRMLGGSELPVGLVPGRVLEYIRDNALY